MRPSIINKIQASGGRVRVRSDGKLLKENERKKQKETRV